MELTAEDVSATIGAGEGAKETREELLQAALWAWYNAGYQTGLYHAAVGVAGVAEGEGE